MDWWVTSRCNLACDFCYGPRPTTDPAQVRGAVVESIAQSSATVVTFCGGEPLLVRQLPAFAERLRQAGKRTVLNTNAELLRRRHRTFGTIPYDIIGISLDGPDRAVHHAMRGGRANFDETIAAADWVASHDPGRLKVASVVSAVNVAALGQLAVLVRRLRPAVWRLYQYSPWGEVNRGQDRHRIDADEFTVAAAHAAKVCAPVRLAASSERTTMGCLIVDPVGQVLVPGMGGYRTMGNCLDTRIDTLYAQVPHRDTIAENKRWLTEIQP